MGRKRAASPRPRKPRLPTVNANLPPDSPGLYNHCVASWAAFAGNPKLVAAVSPVAAEATENLAALGAALQVAPGGPAVTEAIQANAEKVRQSWHLLAKYTQAFVRSGDIEDAGTIVASVLMTLSNVGKRHLQAPLTATPGTAPGTALLVVLRVMDALLYTYEWSVDEVNWTAGTWNKVRYTVTGLTSGKTYYFRVTAYLRNNTTTSPVGPVHLTMP